MKNYNKLAALGSALTFSIGATACNSEPKASKIKASEGNHLIAVHSKSNDYPDIQFTYFKNGTRKIDIKNDNANEYNTIYEFCDGPDLVEETARSVLGSAGKSGSISRSVDYQECNDGKLTPSDFALIDK